jgi:hypothetical protein
MVGQPFEDVGLFVSGVVVDDGLDDFSGWDGSLDRVEETDEFLVAMPSHAASDVNGAAVFLKSGAAKFPSLAVGDQPWA